MAKAKKYHHGNLRAALVEKAREVVEASGDSAMSLRACAREVGVDVAAAYRHFRSKGDVLAAVASDGFGDLAREMASAMEEVGRTHERAEEYFVCCGRTYIRFGLAHQHLYRLMFGGRCTVAEIQAQGRKSGRPPHPGASELLSDALALLVEAGVISKAARETAHFLAWSMVHGLASLLLEGRGGVQPEEYDDWIERSCRTLLRGFRCEDADGG